MLIHKNGKKLASLFSTLAKRHTQLNAKQDLQHQLLQDQLSLLNGKSSNALLVQLPKSSREECENSAAGIITVMIDLNGC